MRAIPATDTHRADAERSWLPAEWMSAISEASTAGPSTGSR